jgi:RHS repeat-associated protein
MPMKVRYTSFLGRVVREDRAGTVRDYGRDTLGSTAALYDSSGNKTDEFHYWPYGEVRSHTGSSTTPLTYVGTLGYFQDSASRYYVRARVYRADLGRWTTVDPLWPEESAYGYVGGMPSGRMDPSGRQRLDPVGDYLGKLFPSGPGIPTWILPEPINPSPPCGTPKPWPAFGLWGTWGWGYGKCCGGTRKCGPASKTYGCTDEACRAHDVCVGPGGAFEQPTLGNAVRWRPCNQRFCNDVKFCWNRSCTGFPVDLKQCKAIVDIANGFCHSFGGGPPQLLHPWT